LFVHPVLAGVLGTYVHVDAFGRDAASVLFTASVI
jgi:hypothetical protein